MIPLILLLELTAVQYPVSNPDYPIPKKNPAPTARPIREANDRLEEKRGSKNQEESKAIFVIITPPPHHHCPAH
ncbi:hypothetical protein BKA80DRAFT_80051 [Phyllosticta citrichinensis]